MTTAKDEFIKTISYIKHDITEAETELNETREALGYLNKLPHHLRSRNASRIAKYNEVIEKQSKALRNYKLELKEFIRDTKFDKALADSIKPATAEELQRDYEQDMAEVNHPRATERAYNEGQHLEIVAYCESLQAKGLDDKYLTAIAV